MLYLIKYFNIKYYIKLQMDKIPSICKWNCKVASDWPKGPLNRPRAQDNLQS